MQNLNFEKVKFPYFMDEIIRDLREEKTDLEIIKFLLTKMHTAESDWAIENYMKFLTGMISGYEIEKEEYYYIYEPLSEMYLCYMIDKYNWYRKKIGKYMFRKEEIDTMGEHLKLMKKKVEDGG